MIWLPDGILLAALLRSSRRRWGWLVLSVFPTSVVQNISIGHSLSESLLSFPVDLLAPLVAAFLIQRFAGPGIALSKIRECLVFALATAACVSASATAGVFLHLHATGDGYWPTWRSWWISGEVGMLIAAPVLLAWMPWKPLKLSILEAAAALASTFAVSSFLFSATGGHESALLTFPYWVFPVLMWTALRLGPRGSSAAMAIIAGVAITNTMLARGPFTFASDTLGGQMAALESFLIVTALSSMLLSAAIGERHTAQIALGESESRFRLMVENLPAGAIYRQDEKIFLNKAAEAITGYSCSEIQSLDIWFQRLYGAEAQTARKLYERDRDALFPTVRRVPIRRKDGDTRILEFAGFIDPRYEVWLLDDLTERLRAEEKLRDAELRYRNLFENAPDGIFQATPAGRLLTANPAIALMLGYASPEDLIANLPDIADCFSDPEDRKYYYRMIEKGDNVHGFEREALRRDGKRVWLSVSARCVRNAFGTTLFSEGSVKDVTGRRLLEAQLAQSQKMEAIGQLAGGIAHDFNNLLTVISGYSQMLLDKVEAGSSLRAGLTQIDFAANRAASLTSQLLAFSRQQVIQPKLLDLNEVVEGMLTLLRRLIREDIELKTAPVEGLARVKADRGQIEQVIVNLVTNSRDAIEGSGEIVIETANIILHPEDAKKGRDCEPGPCVMLVVRDTGQGMDERTRSRVFDPFFTTKEVGRGTGLGLATVYGIVKQSLGDIWVDSEPGRGTTFKICLPEAPLEAQPGEELEERKAEPITGTGGTETVLVVEDEPSVRELVRYWLTSLGYKVVVAEALMATRVCAEHEKIDLLLTDVVMPGMGGPMLANQLRVTYPRMKVLFMSGYTDNPDHRNGNLAPGENFLQKPFTPETLAGKIREVLA